MSNETGQLVSNSASSRDFSIGQLPMYRETAAATQSKITSIIPSSIVSVNHQNAGASIPSFDSGTARLRLGARLVHDAIVSNDDAVCICICLFV